MAKTIYSQDASKFVVALAAKLKDIPEFQVPEWSHFVKTGSSKERPPTQADFWYTRAASILRQLYIKGVVGVGRLRTRYGTRKDRGTKPDQFKKASGKIIRLILQQAEKAGLVEKLARLQHGRRLTQTGRDLLDSVEAPVEDSIDLSEVLVHKAPEAQEDIEVAAEGEATEEESEEKTEEEKSEDVKNG